MRILRTKTGTEIKYLMYDGWVSYPKEGPLDLSDCILFTEAEAKLNPTLGTYQHWGCYAPIKEL